MRAVIDTNIFVSGIFWEGNSCSKIIKAWTTGNFTLVSSIPIIGELTRILRTFKIKMDEDIITEWQNMILENSIIVEPIERLNIVKADPEDNKFFEAAIAGNADYIISQDNHLLEIGSYDGIEVLSPIQFLKLL